MSKLRILATEDARRERMAICRECPKLTTGQRCRICGCHVAMKTRLAILRCPIGKW